MILPRWAYQLLLFATVLIHFYIAYSLQRVDTAEVLGCFGVLWLIFIVKWTDFKVGIKQIIGLGMLFRLVYLLAVPELSDDVFRYIWDGMLVMDGQSPYQSVPTDILAESEGLYRSWIPLLNSPDYHSIYPPVLQLVFGFSVLVGGDMFLSIVVLRGLVLLAEFGSIFLIWKLVKKWNWNQRNLMLYALNPLVIIEFVGNLHGEVFMVFFLLLSVWLLTQERTWISAGVFGLAIGTKLLPLMFLPFFIKRIGKVRAVGYGVVSIGIVALLYVPFWTPDLVQNTRDTLGFYFKYFEFNGSIYYLVREVGYWYKGYNIIAETATWLPRIVLISILGIAWLNKERTMFSLPKMMLFAWFIYYAFATTVNPWYVAVLAAFLPFVKCRFALVWLMLIPLSYHAYGNADYQENLWVIALEYVPVYGWLGFELDLFIKVEKWWALKRAKVKEQRLFSFLKKGQSVLEFGAGNGALAKLLKEEDMKVTSLDIEDQSLFGEVKVYHGEIFPFAEKQFDVCQMITMLHHTANAEQLIQEAKRVSNRIIIMEDIYESQFQKYIIWFADSLVNWEFYGHPHTNRTDSEWKVLFEKNGLTLESVEYYRFLFFFKQVTYVLKAD